MSTALSFAAVPFSLAQGLGKRAALRTQAKSLEYKANAERIRGKQISARRRDQLHNSLASIDAIRSSRGLSVDSPGGLNIRRQVRENAAENENAEVLSSKFQEMNLRNQAASRRRASFFALLGGIGNATTSLVSSLDRE